MSIRPRAIRFCVFCTAVILVAMATVSAGCDDPVQASAIPPDELARRIASGDAPLILDVRTPEEFVDGHLPGARNVHCHSGRRAVAAETVLREAGYTNVRDLTGHWQAWKQAGLPTE
jgi:rhodanese-related sulfurtransferase